MSQMKKVGFSEQTVTVQVSPTGLKRTKTNSIPYAIN